MAGKKVKYSVRSGEKDLIKLSKSLSWLLRHGASQEGLQFDEGGYIDVNKILALKQFRRYEESDIVKVVETNDKKRFDLRRKSEPGTLQIRANQGHSIPVAEEGLLAVLSESTAPETIVHGTYLSKIDKILSQGLCRMNRNHVHFAPGLPKEGGVISGMRSSCDVYIVLDVKKALSSGLILYSSSNNVYLCAGDDKGFISPAFFKEVWQMSPRKRIL